MEINNNVVHRSIVHQKELETIVSVTVSCIDITNIAKRCLRTVWFYKINTTRNLARSEGKLSNKL